MNTDTAIFYNARLVDADMDAPGAVVVQGGLIAAVLRGEFRTEADARRAAAGAGVDAAGGRAIDAGGLALMPAFVDTHAHFRYPGQEEKEELGTALAAAAAGGYGTLVLMPNTSPVVSGAEDARAVVRAAARISPVRVFQTVSLTRAFGGTDTSHLDDLDPEKVPVISEDGRDVASAAVMLEAMEKAAARGIVVACHSEDTALAAAAKPFRAAALRAMAGHGIRTGEFSCGIPAGIPAGFAGTPEAAGIERDLRRADFLLALAEDAATARNIDIARAAGCRVHICHCSTARSMDAVRRAKAELAAAGADGGHSAEFRVTAEVTPHHLALTGGRFPQICALVNPPLRTERDRRALIEALRDGTADCIGTDHAPHTAADKAAGAPGFTGLETAFAVCNTVLCTEEGFPLTRLSALMSANPAAILGLNAGRLRAGMEARLVLAAPGERWTVAPAEFKSKGKSTPLAGMTLTGRVHALFIGTERV